jgi:hypothetical protein
MGDDYEPYTDMRAVQGTDHLLMRFGINALFEAVTFGVALRTRTVKVLARDSVEELFIISRATNHENAGEF